jgi:two-component system cell cycle sensor histidine kinase/response regulator CckA
MKVSCPASILIVEDDEGVAVLERRTLERRGFCVHSVADGKEAIAAVQAQPIDLIVMDYRLSDSTNGLDLLSRLQALGYDLPAIMVTGFSNEATAIEALRQGVRDFVPKTTEYLDYLPVAVERVLKSVRTERQLSESEARFQSFMDNSPAIAFVKDATGRLVYANRRFTEECGQSNWQNKSDAELWPAATARQLRDNDAAMRSTNRPHQTTETLIANDGTERYWLTCRFPLADGQGQPLIGVMAVDVTHQKKVEGELRIRDQQLQQAQKMEAIGQLAGGVAHDFNNLLTIILGYSAILAHEEEPPAPERQEMVSEIHRAAQRAADLTGQLLAFSRKQILAPRTLKLNDILRDTQKMLCRLIGEDIEIHLRLAEGLDLVLADPGQIEQIIMNLVVNARDAMPQGGELCVETANVELDENYASSHAEVTPGRYVMLAISDSGHGMDAATRNRIFEPFFTTKAPGKGTGLGLATVYGIVRQSGGHIWVYSEPGQGTTFKVYFPVTAAPAENDATAAPVRGLRGRETILLVEDDDAVRAIARSVLEMYGYTVLEAGEPTSAIRICKAHAGPIDALLTDVVMPRLNGKRLSELLLAERPGMKVLFMSGYTNDSIVRQGILEAGIQFLQKPFTPAALAAKLRSVLNGEALAKPNIEPALSRDG